MEFEEVLVNLRVIEQVQVNQKLISRGPYLNIEYESVIPEFIRRWRRQDNRNETIKKINLVVNSAIELKRVKNIKVDKSLSNIIPGLRSLKETYATCSQTSARIDVIINKIIIATDIKIDDVLLNKIEIPIEDINETIKEDE
tara:strand:+ start:907 stop:1332 length:426 start_codon:yes stop_codon:yes gene_type:complete